MAIFRLTPTQTAHIDWPKRVDVRAPNERRARLVASMQLGGIPIDHHVWIQPETVRCEEVSDSPFPQVGEVTVLTPRITQH